MIVVLKGSSTSGWYAPPKGTHTGEKHRASGSGKSGAKWGDKKTVGAGAGAGKYTYDTLRRDVTSGTPINEAVESVRKFMLDNETAGAYLDVYHGMAKEEVFHSCKAGGLEYRYTDGTKQAAVHAIANLLREREIDPAVAKFTRFIAFTEQRNSADERWSTRYNMPGFKSNATGGGGSIVIYNGRSTDIITMAHEMGHNFAEGMFGNSNPAEASPWMRTPVQKANAARYADIMSKESPYTNYARASGGEDFAEAMKLYYTNTAISAFRMPLRHAEIGRLIKGAAK